MTTLPAGDPATVSVQVVGGALYLIFGIPQGEVGQTGQVGRREPTFANAVVDAVNTLPAGGNTTVSVSYDGSLVHFTFSIPRGTDGATGTPRRSNDPCAGSGHSSGDIWQQREQQCGEPFGRDRGLFLASDTNPNPDKQRR